MGSLIFYWFPKWVDWDIEESWFANCEHSDSQMQRLKENKKWHWTSPRTVTGKPFGELPSGKWRERRRDEVASLFRQSTPEWEQEGVEGFCNEIQLQSRGISFIQNLSRCVLFMRISGMWMEGGEDFFGRGGRGRKTSPVCFPRGKVDVSDAFQSNIFSASSKKEFILEWVQWSWENECYSVHEWWFNYNLSNSLEVFLWNIS